ncbi:MAG: dTMP kinase [Anaerolineae bacterium]
MSLFITFEGPDGSGKSTQITLLAEHLQRQGFDVLQTREPGGTPIGDQIRRVLHDVNNTAMVSRAEVLLYSASRAQLVQQAILPHLAAGGAVICDRYADSTYAYQGYGRQLDFDTLKIITRFATQELKPDITFYLDLDVTEGLKRKQQANHAGTGELNRMDQLALEFYRRVREGYLEMARAEPERWLVIDAGGTVTDVQRQIRERLAQVLQQRVAPGK